MRLSKFLATTVAVAAVFVANSCATADIFEVEFENLQSAGGFSFTPAWVGFHDGTFDTHDVGTTASGSFEALAELGDTSGIAGDFTNAGFLATDQGVLGQPAGFGGAPIVEPGEIASMLFNTNENFFSYASMIIPSNDNFIANGNPMAFDVSTLAPGQSLTFDVVVLYDAGTEQNDPDDGAAFSATGGGAAGGTDENSVITVQNIAAFNAVFGGTATPNGDVTENLSNPIARFTITAAVPEPGSAAVLGVFALAGFLRRRR